MGRPIPATNFDLWMVATVLSVTGLAALAFFYHRNQVLLSGDAVAHINIARRVFDSRTPNPMQLGTVWLPLPHVLTIPFVISTRMWQSGIGGSIVSVISYVLAGVGLFRLLSIWSPLAAWIGTGVLATNPNLLYVQTTALNEPLYLACFLWSTVFFAEARRALQQNDPAAGRWVEKGAIALACGILTRYDGWFLACVCWMVILPEAIANARKVGRENRLVWRKSVSKAMLLTALAPTLWLAVNFGAKGNPLDFAMGPYSAKAIAQRTTERGAPPYPGQSHVLTAGVYFTKAAQLNVGEGVTAKLVVVIAALASLLFAFSSQWPIMIVLWSPLLFYALSIAYGSVPIFVPVWWPFSYYNVRYGLELLPAIAAGAGLSCFFITRLWQAKRIGLTAASLVLSCVAFSYADAWRSVPICLREVRANGQTRYLLDGRLAAVLATIPKTATILAYTGAHSGAFELAAVPLRRTINEGIFAIWDSSLVHPAAAADYVIASDDDPVGIAVSMHPEGLTVLSQIKVEGQPRIVVYRSGPHQEGTAKRDDHRFWHW